MRRLETAGAGMIRRAEPEDIHALQEMGAAFWIEAGWSERFPGLSFCPNSFAITCGQLMDHGILLVAVEDGKVVGMVGAGPSQAWWNFEVRALQEIFWYVQEAYRKGHGRQLADGLEAVAKSLGVHISSMSAEMGLRSQAIGRFLRHRGYFPSEVLFWKQLQGSGA